VRRDMIVEAAAVVDDAVVEVPASLVAERVRKERKRVPWTEERLLCLLQTANSFRYSTIRFKGENLTYDAKVKTMNVTRSAATNTSRCCHC